MGICCYARGKEPIVLTSTSIPDFSFEVWSDILSFLPNEDLCLFAQTCKGYRALVREYTKIQCLVPLSVSGICDTDIPTMRTSFVVDSFFTRVKSYFSACKILDTSATLEAVLIESIASVNLSPALEALKALAYPNLQYEHDYGHATITPLGFACIHGSLELVKTLLVSFPTKHSKDIQISYEEDSEFRELLVLSSLDIAAIQGFDFIAKILISHGIHSENSLVRCSTNAEFRVLHGPGAVSLLVQAYKTHGRLGEPRKPANYLDSFRTLLSFSSLSTGFECLGAPRLLEIYLPELSSELINHRDSEGFTLLERSLKEELYEETLILLPYVKTVSSKVLEYCPEPLLDKIVPLYTDKLSPVYFAVTINALKLLKNLLNKHIYKVDLMEEHDGLYFLQALAHSKNIEMLEVIKENTKILELRDALLYPYETPCLWYALPDKAMCETLLSLGCDIHSLSAPELLIQYGHDLPLVQFLKEQGLDLNGTDRDECNAVWLAYRLSRTDLFGRLRQLQINFNTPQKDGATVLMDACLHGPKASIDLLLSHGARPNSSDRQYYITLLRRNQVLSQSQKERLVHRVQTM